MMKEMLTNRILTGLSAAEFARLMPSLEPVSLSAGEQLAGLGEEEPFVYFPESSVITCHADMQDGRSVEVGMIGKEGLAGLTALVGARPAAQSMKVAVAGTALRVRSEGFERELRGAEALRQALLEYAVEYCAQVSQRAACAVLHRMEQRLAVWLLLLSDRVGADDIQITHERMAQHLGVRRAGVTEAACEFKYQGLISYTRGNLRVLDRRALEAVACECYEALSLTGRRPSFA
jgi:CRP-like cAMP-binding protein